MKRRDNEAVLDREEGREEAQKSRTTTGAARELPSPETALKQQHSSEPRQARLARACSVLSRLVAHGEVSQVLLSSSRACRPPDSVVKVPLPRVTSAQCQDGRDLSRSLWDLASPIFCLNRDAGLDKRHGPYYADAGGLWPQFSSCKTVQPWQCTMYRSETSGGLNA